MKKLIIFLLFVWVLNPLLAQEKFAVPNLNDAQKHRRTLYMGSYMIAVTASMWKQSGQTIENYTVQLGDLVKTTWPSNGDFDVFVKGTLYNWESNRNSNLPTILILEQSDEMIRFVAHIDFKQWFEKGNIHDISFDELMQIYDGIHQKIAEYLGAEYQQTVLNEGTQVEITIRKKNV